MAFLKSLMAKPGFRRGLARVIACYIAFAERTTRWVMEGEADRDRLIEAKRPFVVAFWHGRLAMMPFAWRPGLGFAMLVSEHRDGQLIADVVEHFGIARVSGSTTKGGAKALRAMVQTLKGGTCVGITPDAPRGPRLHANEGVIHLARLAGVPVLPATYATSNRKILGTWDGFNIPLPFSKGAIIWGRAIEVPRVLDETGIAALRAEIEIVMNAQVERADSLVGLEPQRPAPTVEARA